MTPLIDCRTVVENPLRASYLEVPKIGSLGGFDRLDELFKFEFRKTRS